MDTDGLLQAMLRDDLDSADRITRLEGKVLDLEHKEMELLQKIVELQGNIKVLNTTVHALLEGGIAVNNQIGWLLDRVE